MIQRATNHGHFYHKKSVISLNIIYKIKFFYYDRFITCLNC